MKSLEYLGDADAETLRLLVNWISEKVNCDLVDGAVCQFFEDRAGLSFDPETISFRIMEECVAVSDTFESSTISRSILEDQDPEFTALTKYVKICRDNCFQTLHEAVILGRWDVVDSIVRTIITLPLEMECGLTLWMGPPFHHFTSHIYDCIASGNPEMIFDFN